MLLLLMLMMTHDENDPRVQITRDPATTRKISVFLFFFQPLRPSVEDVPKHLTAH